MQTPAVDLEAIRAMRGGSRTGVEMARQNLVVAHRSLNHATGAVRRYNDLLKSDSARKGTVTGLDGSGRRRPPADDRRREFEVRLEHMSATPGPDLSRTFTTIVSADDLSDAWSEANRLAEALKGRVRVVGLADLDGRVVV